MKELDAEYDWHLIRAIGPGGLNFVQPGKLRFLDVEGVRFCISRKGDRLLAIRDKCPHAGAALHRGYLNEKGEVVCPLHRYCFDPETGANTSGEGFGTEALPIVLREDGAWIGFRKPPKRGGFLNFWG